MKSKMDWKQLNGLALAYMGDAVFEKRVRFELLKEGAVRPNKLHRAATTYVSAKAQSYILHELENRELLTDADFAVIKRGRNAKSHTVPKNTDVATYKNSTGFEALLGYLYVLEETERLEQLLSQSIQIIKDKGGQNS